MLAAAVSAAAATIEYDIQPRVLRLGESATCRITIKGASGAPAPTLPPITGFQVISSSTEQNFSFTPNGQESAISYVYQLRPLDAGTFVVGPFTYNLRNESATLPAVEIQVLPAAADASASPVERFNEMLFATLTCASTSAYIQQSFDLVLSVYAQGVNLDRDIGLREFNTAGLKLGGFQELQSGRETVNNQVYDVRRFRVRATALTAGTFTLAPKLRVNIITPRPRQRDPFFGDVFDSFFFSRAQLQAMDLEARPLQLVIKALPQEGRPPGYSGAVGSFTFDVEARPLQVRVGDPVTVTMRIAGSGNIESIAAPALAPGEQFKAYEPKLLQDDPGAGLKVFEQVVIPRTRDATALPPISFTYFDPEAERYQTVVRGPFDLALDAAGAESPLVVQGGTRSPVPIPESLGNDLVYLQALPRTWTSLQAKPWYRSGPLLAMQGLPPLALGLLFLLARRRDELTRDAAKARRLAAPRSARGAMRAAEQTLKAGDAAAFVEALWRVLATYFGNRFNLAPGEVTQDEVARRLQRGGLPTAEVLEIVSLFDDCVNLRFGAGRGTAEALSDAERQEWRRRLDRLNELLRACERIRL